MRQQQRREGLANLWRLLLFLGASTGLTVLVLDQGWQLDRSDQIVVAGSNRIDREEVLKALSLSLPAPLLDLKPRQVEQRLAALLPVEDVQVQRRALPPRLLIELSDREPVARAERLTPSGVEAGLVDREGHWMDRSLIPPDREPLTPIRILGWQKRLRPTLEMVLSQRDSMGSPLISARFEADGALWLTTEALGEVLLGQEDGRHQERLRVMQYLSGKLPDTLSGHFLRTIYLTDPEQPELGIGIPSETDKERQPQ